MVPLTPKACVTPACGCWKEITRTDLRKRLNALTTIYSQAERKQLEDDPKGKVAQLRARLANSPKAQVDAAIERYMANEADQDIERDARKLAKAYLKTIIDEGLPILKANEQDIENSTFFQDIRSHPPAQ